MMKIKPYVLNIAIMFIGITSYCSKVKAQLKNDNTNNYKKKYSYYTVTLLSGASSLFPINNKGLLSVTFPYTLTSSSGSITNNIFISQNKTVWSPARVSYLPVGFEVGNIKHFFSNDISFIDDGLNISAGYGFIWFLNNKSKTSNCINDKRLIIKASVNLIYDIDNGSNIARLGSIDNQNKYIRALGFTANPTYTIVSTRNTRGGTYSAKNLDIGFAQKEISVLPKISIGNNPYRKGLPIKKNQNNSIRYNGKLTWDLSFGYNISLYDRGGILLTQDDGNTNDKTKRITSAISLENNGLTILYNNKVITKTPYRFSGLYISFVIHPGRSKIE